MRWQLGTQAELETSKLFLQSLDEKLQQQNDQKDRCDDCPLGSTMGGWYREMEEASFRFICSDLRP